MIQKPISVHDTFEERIIKEAKNEIAREEHANLVQEVKLKILADRNKKKWYHKVFPYRIIIERL